MKPIAITLPWPPSTLSPNARQHWAALAKAKKRYLNACCLSVLQQRVATPSAPRLDVSLLFVPPDRRRYDCDGLLSRMKAGLDGVASAWGIDDAQFVRMSASVSDTPCAGLAGNPGGCVIVTMREHRIESTIAGVGPDCDGSSVGQTDISKSSKG